MTIRSRAEVSITPGRDYASRVRDWGLSGELDLRPRRRRAHLDHRLSLQQIYARPGRRLQQSRHPLSRQRRRGIQPLQDLQRGTAASGQDVRQPARLAGRRLLRQREARRSTTTSPMAPIMRGSATASSQPTSSVAERPRACLRRRVADLLQYTRCIRRPGALIGAYNAALAASQFTAAANLAGQIGALSAFARLPNAGLPASIPCRTSAARRSPTAAFRTSPARS